MLCTNYILHIAIVDNDSKHINIDHIVIAYNLTDIIDGGKQINIDNDHIFLDSTQTNVITMLLQTIFLDVVDHNKYVSVDKNYILGTIIV